MCLAIPGKIVSIRDGDGTDVATTSPLMRTGKVDFGGVVREVSLAYVPEADVGDYVIVHVGFAISTVDQEEAEQVFEYVRQMDGLETLQNRQDARSIR